MAGGEGMKKKKISATSARSHTRKPHPNTSSYLPSGIFTKVLLLSFVAILAWTYQAIQPPPTKICGSPGGPSVTGPRIKLRDGRHLAYKEHGVSKDVAKYKIIYLYGFGSCVHDRFLDINLSPEFAEQLGVYILNFDRPGYGESDPHPSRTLKSLALDIEELADKLGLGSKFYLIGNSMGGAYGWSCLKYIPHRIAGVSLVAPAVNFWLSGFPANLSTEAYHKLLPQDQWAFRVIHYAPWLGYWWNTQKWFPPASFISLPLDIFSRQDKEIAAKFVGSSNFMEYAKQQGEGESIYRDAGIAFGKWEFDPMDMENPFPNNEASVHLWQGEEDVVVPAKLQRYIVQRLPWIRYHELQGGGMNNKLSGRANQNTSFNLPSGIVTKVLLVFFAGILAWAYQAIQPPPTKICGSPGGPSITGPRIKLRDGRHLAYKEYGVSKDVAKYKFIYIHGFKSSRHDGVPQNHLSREFAEQLGVYIVNFDRPGYGESDPHPGRTLKSLTSDIEELADQLGLGSKFYMIGYSMGAELTWPCLKYIPHRLAGVLLLTPATNYWWPGFPANLSTQVYRGMLPQDQWAFRVVHYAPWLSYWWHLQNWFPRSAVIASDPNVFTEQDREILAKGKSKILEYGRQQGDAESIHRDMAIAFGKWEFDPMEIENPYPNNEGSVHLWQGDEDLLVPVKLQRYIVKRLPWIRYHELPGSGHLFPALDGMFERMIRLMLTGE